MSIFDLPEGSNDMLPSELEDFGSCPTHEDEEEESLSPIEAAKMERQFELLQLWPEKRAEAIAYHYAKHINMVKDLVEAVELRKFQASRALDDLIANHIKTICDNHRSDLGIELNWDCE